MKRIVVLASWNLLKVDGVYHISGTHFTYMRYASQNFERVYLISSVRNVTDAANQQSLALLTNVEVVELPPVDSYLSAYKNFTYYYRAIKSIKDKVDFIYCRVPDPFCWMPKLVFDMRTVMHYVGDTVEATRNNEKWSRLRKMIMIGGYLPELWLTYRASRSSNTYTNGPHLKDKLLKRNINAEAVISSTISERDLQVPSEFRVTDNPRLLYVGYLRHAKGMKLLMDLWLRLKSENPRFIFDVVGNGEMQAEIRSFVENNGLQNNVVLHGRIDNREEIKRIMRQADLFIFPSLSEGSPRVVIEAMAEGVPVISTPVGSLPGTFDDGDTISYFDFNDADKAHHLIKEYALRPEKFKRQRDNAYSVIKDNFTQEKFLSKIYSYEA